MSKHIEELEEETCETCDRYERHADCPRPMEHKEGPCENSRTVWSVGEVK